MEINTTPFEENRGRQTAESTFLNREKLASKLWTGTGNADKTSSIGHPTVWKWKQTFFFAKGMQQQKGGQEGSSEGYDRDIDSRKRVIHLQQQEEEASMKEHQVNYWLQRGLIAPDWPHSIIVILYSSFYYLLPLQTHTYSLLHTHTHTRRHTDSHSQYHHNAFHCLHYTTTCRIIV